MKQSGGLSSPIDCFYSGKMPAPSPVPDRKEMISSIILDAKKEQDKKSEAETKSVKGNKPND